MFLSSDVELLKYAYAAGSFKSSFSRIYETVLGGWNNFFLLHSLQLKFPEEQNTQDVIVAPEKKILNLTLKANALFYITSDPPDYFSGGSPTPRSKCSNQDGIFP